MAIFPIVLALDPLLCIEILNSDVCRNTETLFDLRLWYVLMADKGEAKKKPKKRTDLNLRFLPGIVTSTLKFSSKPRTMGLGCWTAMG